MEVNKIYQGDCLELMKQIEDKSVDMVLCDLPYSLTQNKWDSEINLVEIWKEYKRIKTEKAVIVLTASQPFSSKLVMSNIEMFKHEWIWVKNKGSNFANTVREPFKEHEHVLIFGTKKWTYNKQMQKRTGSGLARVKYDFTNEVGTENYGKFNRDGRRTVPELRVPSSIQRFKMEMGLHPTQKPVPLFEYLVKTYTNEGDLVLDNCIGSGTTAVACKQLNRNFIGIEKEQKYVEIANKRLSQEVLI